MEANQMQQEPPDQLNPGQQDQFGNEVVIKKNESISDQGNEWADKEGMSTNESGILGEKAEKYIKDSADIEDMPEEEDNKAAAASMEKGNAADAAARNEEEPDDVIESEDEFVPGYDLGRNKVQ